MFAIVQLLVACYVCHCAAASSQLCVLLYSFRCVCRSLDSWHLITLFESAVAANGTHCSRIWTDPIKPSGCEGIVIGVNISMKFLCTHSAAKSQPMHIPCWLCCGFSCILLHFQHWLIPIPKVYRFVALAAAGGHKCISICHAISDGPLYTRT